MKIGIGIPNSVVGATGRQVKDWARTAEAVGFSTLATIGRVAYPSYDSLVALTAAGAVTERIGLMTDILLGPTYHPVVLAKLAASADQLTEGRLVIGTAVGARRDDYELTGVPFAERGRRLDEALELMHRTWAGEPIPSSPYPVAPSPHNGRNVPMMFGGTSEASVRRVVRWGVGWTQGGGGPQPLPAMLERVRSAWHEGGRGGEPRTAALTYFGVGPRAEQQFEEYFAKGYYAYLGERAQVLAQRTPHDPESLRAAVRAYEDTGVDELIFFPTASSLDQVEGLAEAVL